MDDVEVAILSKLSKEDDCDAEEHFGLHVASVLHSLPPRQRAYTKIEIDRLLFNAQFSEPHGHNPTASFHSYPPSTSNPYPLSTSNSYPPPTLPTSQPATHLPSSDPQIPLY